MNTVNLDAAPSHDIFLDVILKLVKESVKQRVSPHAMASCLGFGLIWRADLLTGGTNFFCVHYISFSLRDK